jgi:antibiotic biosynthesis monooxygenase (ABM) superfamily enzyme
MTENQFSEYRHTTPTRPRWATALIVAAVLVVAGLIFVVTSGLPTALWFFGAALVTALVAGILALVKVRV